MNGTLLILALAIVPAADPYPNANLLIESEEVEAYGPTVILDAREQRAYATGHIRRAAQLPLADWSKALSDTPESWAARLGRLGIRANSHVLVYGGADVRDAARAWWLLKVAGVEHVRLLNGGYPAWKKSGGATETIASAYAPVEFGPVAKTDRLAEKKDVAAVLKDGKAQIIDARSDDEYCGRTNTAKRNGHIPGAIAIEWTELLGADKKFKSPAELKKLFAERKIDLDKPAITYCQSGGRAAVMAVGLELMGVKNVRNYYKSWSEWGNAEDTQIEVPKK